MNELATIAKKMNTICTDHALPDRFCIATTRLPRGLGLALEMHPDKVNWRLTLSRRIKTPSAQEIANCRKAFNVPGANLKHGQVITDAGEIHNIVRLLWNTKAQPSLLNEEETDEENTT